MSASTSRRLETAGFCAISSLPKGPNGRALCRWCSVEVAPPARTFCSNACVHEWKIRTQADYAKMHVAKRDDGICALCRVDTFAALRPLPNREFPSREARRCFDMDHIVPVVEGGGACGLDNLRTLCRPCHRAVTAELQKRRAAARRAAKTGGEP